MCCVNSLFIKDDSLFCITTFIIRRWPIPCLATAISSLPVSRCFRVVVNDPVETGTVLTCTHKVKQGHKIPDIETSAKPINMYKCDKDVVFKQKISWNLHNKYTLHNGIHLYNFYIIILCRYCIIWDFWYMYLHLSSDCWSLKRGNSLDMWKMYTCQRYYICIIYP